MKSKRINGHGYEEWKLPNGKFHREDGPALEYINGNKLWYINGKLHRENGPAREYVNGDKEWYVNGQRHREDGPAIEWSHGRKEWYVNGQRHREDGPAVECINGDDYKWWYLNNVEYTEQEYKRKTRSRKLSKLLK